MNRFLTRTQKVAYAAMVLGLYVVATRLVGLVQPAPVFSFNRIGIGIPLIVFTSLFLGPFYGAFIGVAGDALGWVLLGSWTGPFNVFLSVYYALVGILPWAVHKLGHKGFAAKRSLLAFFITYGALFLVFLGTLIFTDAFHIGFARWEVEPAIGKTVVGIVSGVMFVLTVLGLLWIRKKNPEDETIGEIAWHSLIIEAFTIFLKPLAFYVYCWVFVGQDISVAWGVSYSTLVLISILFSFVDIFVTAAFLRLFRFTAKSVMKKRANHETH